MTVSTSSAADRGGAPYEHAGTYAFDPEWAGERERLALLEAYCDPHSRQVLRSTGVGRGWRCLDVGAGAGSIARWLGGVVGDPGRVVALDLDGRFAAELEPDGIAVARADVRTWRPAEPFDLVHARFLLVHLPDRDAVLRRLLELVRPGGWLVATECAYESWAWDPASPYGKVAAAYVAHARELGWPLSYGRELPHAFEALGLAQVRADAWARFERPGDLGPRLIAAIFESQRTALLSEGAVTETDIAAAIEQLHGGERGMSYITTWTTVGRRPPGA